MQSVANGECWNESGGLIYLDSCHAPDANEYFDFVSCPNAPNYWCIHNYAEGNTLNVAGDRDGQRLARRSLATMREQGETVMRILTWLGSTAVALPCHRPP